jgi:hypothetical protein
MAGASSPAGVSNNKVVKHPCWSSSQGWCQSTSSWSQQFLTLVSKQVSDHHWLECQNTTVCASLKKFLKNLSPSGASSQHHTPRWCQHTPSWEAKQVSEHHGLCHNFTSWCAIVRTPQAGVFENTANWCQNRCLKTTGCSETTASC